MASNKNQHYVPRCYLRAFTEHGDGVRINLFNTDRERVIPLVSARHQCSRAYFYGSDAELEAAIQQRGGDRSQMQEGSNGGHPIQ